MESCPNRCEAEARPIDRAAAPPWQVAGCSACGLMFTDPRPAASDRSLYYPDDFGPYQVPPPARWGKRLMRGLEAWVARRLGTGRLRPLAEAWLDPVVLPPMGGRRMVDIGCGGSDYPARMRAAGWQVTGLEPNARAAVRSREHYGIDVIADDFPSPRLPAGGFDLVTAHQVLEHLDDPRAALAAMRDLLAPAGRLLITVPNAAGWSSRFFGPAWIGWDLPRHLTHFTADTLAAMAKAVGLKVVRMTTLAEGGWMRRSAEGAVAAGLPANRRWFAGRNLSDTWGRVLKLAGDADILLMIAQREQR